VKLSHHDGRIAIDIADRDFTPHQQVALLGRMLHNEGYDDHAAGHITFVQPDGTILANPHGFAWDEIRASDVVRIDRDGRVMEGSWPVSAAIGLMLELHERRSDAVIGLHHHPRFATIWSAVGRIPPGYDQRSCQLRADQIAMFTDYAGVVTDREQARQNVDALGDADVAFLANHGVLVLGGDAHEAFLRATALEWRSKQAWYVEALGGGIPMPPQQADTFADMVTNHLDVAANTFACMARRVIRADPAVLD